MGWQSLGSFSLSQQWQTTSLVTGELFRVKHSPIPNNGQKPRGVIAQSFIDEENQFNTFESKLLVYKQEIESFSFYFPSGLSEHSLAVKRLDALDFSWEVSIEVFSPESDSQALEINKYYELFLLLQSVPLPVSTVSKALIPSYTEVLVRKNKTQLICAANANRKSLVIRGEYSKEIILGFSVDERGSLKEKIWKVKDDEPFTLPVNYLGDIYGIPKRTGNIYVCEFLEV